MGDQEAKRLVDKKKKKGKVRKDKRRPEKEKGRKKEEGRDEVNKIN